MADIFYRFSDGNDANAGTAAAPKKTLQASMTAAGAGGRVFASNLNNETLANANATITSPGTIAAFCQVLSVSDWGADEDPTPTLQAGAKISLGNYTWDWENYGYIYGLSIHQTASSNRRLCFGAFNASHWILDTCDVGQLNSGNDRLIDIGQDSASPTEAPHVVELINTTLRAAATGQSVAVHNTLIARGIAFAGTVPTTLLEPSSNRRHPRMRMHCCDLSSFGAGRNLVNVGAVSEWEALFSRCRLGSGVALTTGTYASRYNHVRLVECDHGTNYIRQAWSDYEGLVTEDTVRKRTASLYSHKLVTTANSKFYSPLRSFPLARFNATEGESVTVNVYTLTDNVMLNNEDFFIEASYLGNASYPLGSLASSAKADILATAANYATTTEEWTTTDITTPVKQLIPVTFTPQKSGPVIVTACLAKPSTTVYADADPELA